MSEVLKEGKLLKGRCGECAMHELCGGCRGRAHAATGDYMAEDPHCYFLE